MSVRVSLEEKEASVLALALTLALFQYPERTKVATGISDLASIQFFLILKWPSSIFV